MATLNERRYDFLRFAAERHATFMRRHGLSVARAWSLEELKALIDQRHLLTRNAPAVSYTDDPIISRFRFCNVYRELDRVTSWLRSEWYTPRAEHRNLWFSVCMARQINLIDTLAAVGFPLRWDPERVAGIMQKRRDHGHKIYTSAYMLTGTLGGTKIDQTVHKILDPLYHRPPPFTRETDTSPPMSLAAAHAQLVGRPGFKGFMAYEVISDLRWTRYLNNAPDINTWAFAGPGAQRGLARIHERAVRLKGVRRTETVPDKQAQEEMRDLLQWVNARLPRWMPLWEAREVEHTLCEFDKYERARLGEGRPKALFRAPFRVEIVG